MFTPRQYQVEAIDAGINFFNSDNKGNAIEILPTGSGKSICISHIGLGLSGKTLVLQPSKEILEQNVRKYTSYGFRAGIYSASAGSKHIDKITFATIGSIAKKWHLFRDVEHIIIDECHLVNSEDGMYQDFLTKNSQAKVLGLTATPYRLTSGADGSMLKFLTRTTPRIFKDVIYYVQNDVLFNAGHLAKLEYYNFNVVDRTKILLNSNGSDFSEASLRSYFRSIDMPSKTVHYAKYILSKRKNLLIFCSLLDEAAKVASKIPGAVVLDGQTEMAKRERILSEFTKGKIRCVVNVGVLTTGFDYPELEAVLMARSTMSLALYYQIIGRVMRPHKNKESGWFVDLGGNVDLFGKIETMQIKVNAKGQHYIVNNGRQLTDVSFTKTA